MDYKRLLKKLGSQAPGIKELIAERNELRAQLDEIYRERLEQERLARIKPKVVLPIAEKDLLAAGSVLTNKIRRSASQKAHSPLTINWVIPPPLSHEGGGHHNIMRCIKFLESNGNICRIYNYDPTRATTIENIKKIAADAYPGVRATHYYGVANMKDCDAVFATSWETAYPVLGFKSSAKKFYFVQDYEPWFFPVGAMSSLAKRTYGFGFYGVTLGEWLSKKLTAEHEMDCDYIDFGYDKEEYSRINHNERKNILFYYQPGKARRGFEIGVEALKIFKKQHPEYEIIFLGTQKVDYAIPFHYSNAGTVKRDELNTIYNQCAAALVLSFTNFSLLPLELLAAGCLPVVNKGENNQMNSNNNYISYCEPLPIKLAEGLSKTVEQKNLSSLASRASKSVINHSWSSSYQKVENILLREIREQ